MSYQIPAFVTDPADCPVFYEFDSTPPDALQAISFDQNTRTFTFSFSSSLSLASNVPYEITVQGKAGLVSAPKIDSAIMTLELKNPCLDPNFVSISSVAMLSPRSYTDSTFAQWTHDPFQIVTQPISHQFCGSLAYTATYLGQEINSQTMPMGYTSDTLTFTFFSVDNLQGLFEFTLQAHLKNFPAITSAAPEVAYLQIGEACVDIQMITPSSLADQEYTITDNTLYFSFSKFVSSPSDCTLDYTFTVDPLLDAVITLNSAAKSFSFHNDADVNLAGAYVVTLTGGLDGFSATASATFTLTLNNPCLSPNFVTITPAEIPLNIYELGAPALQFQHPEYTLATSPVNH